MSYLPDGVPLPQANPDDRPYWEFIRNRELRIQRCSDCGRFRHPPMPCCPNCRSEATEWVPVSGDGEVFSYTIVRYAPHAALKTAVPFNVSVILLEGAGDVRIVSNVIDAEPEDMRVGLKVRLVWEPTADGGFLPRFARREGGTA